MAENIKTKTVMIDRFDIPCKTHIFLLLINRLLRKNNRLPVPVDLQTVKQAVHNRENPVALHKK